LAKEILTYPSEADFIALAVKTTDTVLGFAEIVELDKSKAEQVRNVK
jgi:hypothetical protein